MAPEKLGKYDIRGTLGRGAMGLVYDGWDPLIHRQVAIKTVRLGSADDEEATEGVARFRREAQAAGRLSHPNIIGVFDFGETDEIAYIVMEFVAGGSLKDLLDRREALAPARVCAIMRQVLAGLAYSHARGVVHRDVKPANVMLTEEGGVKLADFGIARIESSGATSVGAIMGTPSYMAPEQFLGETADARSDIYAAGAMLFHLLTGTRPYEGNPSAVMQKVLNAAQPPAASERRAGLPAGFDPVLRRAMARRREDRFEDAATFAAALETALREEPEEDRTVISRPRPPPAPPATPSEAAKSGAAPSRLPLIAAAAAVALAASGAAWFLSRTAPPRASEQASATVQPSPTPQPGPSPPRPVPPDPAQALKAVRSAIAGLPCHTAQAAIGSGAITLTGLTQAGDRSDQLRATAETASSGLALDWRVRTFDGPYCGVLDAIRPALTAGLVRIGIKDSRTEYLDGQTIAEGHHIHSAYGGLDFSAFLRVDYFSSDGNVSHIYPQVADKQAGVSEDDPATTLPPGKTLNLGYKPRPAFVPRPPFGTDMVTAVASSHDLLAGTRPNTEPAGPYLEALRAAVLMEHAPLAAGIRLIETVAAAGQAAPPAPVP